VNVGRNESSADQLLAVGGGQAAMAVGTTASLGTIYQVQEGGQYQDVKVGVAPLYGPSAGNGGVTVGGGSLWIVGKGMSDAQKAASWDFGKWLDEPQQQAHWHALTGYVPIRKSAVKLPEVTALWKKRPTYRVAYDQLAASHIEQGGPAIGPYKEFRDALIDSLEAIVLRKTPAAQALAQAQSAATEAFSSYNERVGG
jgi:sn-glycerol 3-phosphate transport system substrate-binding protein